MKILHVLYSGLGGHGNVFFSMVAADKDAAYEALFVGVEEVREDYISNCRALGIPWNFVRKTSGSHFGFLFAVAKAIRKSKAQVIFLHSSIYVPAAKMAVALMPGRQKIIVRETQANHLKSDREWLALKMALRLADKVVFLSKEYNEEISQRLSGYYKPAKIAVIPNGIDLTAFQPLSRPPGAVLSIGMQSRIVPIKDHETLLRAMKLVVSALPHNTPVLSIAGDGESKLGLERLVIELGLEGKVHFTGMLNEKALTGFLQSLDIYVHASFGETMSTAIMQAMACALPIIASDVKGINNMVTAGTTALLVPVQDAQALANAMLSLVNDKAARAQLGSNALAYAQQHFSNHIMVQKYRQLY